MSSTNKEDVLTDKLGECEERETVADEKDTIKDNDTTPPPTKKQPDSESIQDIKLTSGVETNNSTNIKTEEEQKSTIQERSSQIKTLTFDTPLIEGIILRREGQFIIHVKLGKEELACHCPTRGRIGNFELAGRPCLLSESKNTKRRTKYTVEAVSLNRPEDAEKEWIGINQIAANRYVEYFLEHNSMEKMIESDGKVLREQVLGNSRLDFLVNNTYLEVKTALNTIQLDIPDYVKTKKQNPSISVERMEKHITELKNSLQSHQRAILLLVFMYNNPGFQVLERSRKYDHVHSVFEACLNAGMEIWQVNLIISTTGITLDRYEEIPREQIM